MRRLILVIGLCSLGLAAQQPAPAPDPNDAPPRATTGPPPPRRPAPPLGKEESSSRQTKIDLSPPPGEAADYPTSTATGDVEEVHPWDPHRADKNVEIGDFYFKRENYSAAASRYREALQWKPNDAIATFRLAETLEKLGQFAEARRNYSAYLKILPKGPFAQQARQAVERLKDKPDHPLATSQKPPL